MSLFSYRVEGLQCVIISDRDGVQLVEGKCMYGLFLICNTIVKALPFSPTCRCTCNRYSMAVSDVWHIHVPRPEGHSPEGEGVYMPYITHCHAICYINPV